MAFVIIIVAVMAMIACGGTMRDVMGIIVWIAVTLVAILLIAPGPVEPSPLKELNCSASQIRDDCWADSDPTIWNQEMDPEPAEPEALPEERSAASTAG
jgi:hypothetical protein